MVNTTNPHYITQNATGTSLTQPVDTVDFPHSGLIKALNQMAAGNVVVKTGTDFDINQTGGNLVVAAGKILRNGKYAEVATKTFADSALTTTYAKGYHLLVVADGREGGETVNVLYMRPPTANLRVPEFKLGDTIVGLVEYSSSTSAGSRLIQYFTTNKESNSLSIAYANSNVYTQAMTVDADADGDVTFENVVQDKDIIFKVDDGGTPTEIMRIDGSTSSVGIGATAPTAKLEVSGDTAISRSADLSQTRTLSIEGARNATGTDYARIDLKNYDSNSGSPATYVGARISAINEVTGVDDGSLVLSTANAGTLAERMRITDAGNVGIGTSSPDTNAALSIEGALSLDEMSAPTNTADRGQLYTNSDNELHMIDGAGTDAIFLKGGLHTIWVPATAMYATTTDGCSALTQVEQTALRPELKVLDFAAAADDHAQFSIAMPKNWNEGVIQFQAFWTVTGTDTGLVAWGLTAQGVINSGVTNTGFSALTTNTPLAHSGTSNDLMVSAKSGNVTVLNAAADAVTYFMLARDVSAESADAQTGVARLIGIKLFYTIDAGNDV